MERTSRLPYRSQQDPLLSTSSDTRTTDAIAFLLAHKSDRHEWTQVVGDEQQSDGSAEQVTLLDLSFVTEKWWPVLTGNKNVDAPATRVLRRPLEFCILTEVMQDLKSGDLYIPGSDRYSDYRQQLVSEEECRSGIALYGERAGISVDPATFVAQLRQRLLKVAADADEGFPQNEYLTIDGAEATLKRLRRKPEPAGLRRFEKLLKERMEPVGILEALSDTEEWLNWTRHFGPISGNDRKLENPTERYLITTFCYGFDFGPTQTSRSIRGLDRRQVAFVNQRHVTEEKLNEAIATVVNGYSKCELTKVWGLANSASGDGTKWDLSPQNLMSEYHIRYGGYGGIGYLVSDLYIALFRHRPVQPLYNVRFVGGPSHFGFSARKHLGRPAGCHSHRYAGSERRDFQLGSPPRHSITTAHSELERSAFLSARSRDPLQTH